jgi:hypothetical protein
MSCVTFSASCAATPQRSERRPSHHGWAGDCAVARRCGERVRIEESDCVRGFAIASTQTLSQLTALIQPNPSLQPQVIEGHPGAMDAVRQ